MKDLKVILTGGPSSGKTTLITELEKRNYSVVHEVARHVLEERKNFEPTKSEWEIRQKMIYEKQLSEENNSQGLVFFDRSILDGIAYSKHLIGFVPYVAAKTNYDLVFNLERLPFVNDGLRIESGDEEAQELHEKILNTYLENGYSPIEIPAIKDDSIPRAISRRADYLIEKVNERI